MLYGCPRNPLAHRSRHPHAAHLSSLLCKSQQLPVALCQGQAAGTACFQACSRTTVYSTSKGGGMGVCYIQLTWPANTTTFNPLRVLRAGDVAQLMRGANHSSQPPLDVARPPCPVARVPFLSSCTRVRKRDEIMSVRIGTLALHESRSGLVAGHCPLLCVTRPSSQGSHEYVVHAVAGTPRQPPHGEECQCRVETGVSGKGMTSCRNFNHCTLTFSTPCVTDDFMLMNELMLQLV